MIYIPTLAKTSIMRSHSIILLTVVFYSLAHGQEASIEYAEDVKSIDAIIHAYYDVISGSSQDSWQFERDKFIHSKNAIITKWDEGGKKGPHSLESEYIPILLAPREDWYEKELKRKVSQYGNIAQVWSAFEIRTDPEVPSNIRGLNSIQLHFEDGRWWIDSWTGIMETEENRFVKEFLEQN